MFLDPRKIFLNNSLLLNKCLPPKERKKSS